ncbi:MAG TPA: hypothetical protein PK360_10300 [bacterium]|nr:hypothetical protein [bacterium]
MMKRSDYTLMSLVVLVSVLAAAVPVHAEEPSIAAMREHSQKIMPFSCTIEGHLLTHPMFSDAGEATQYEMQRLAARQQEIGRSMDQATYEKVLQNNVKYYLEGNMSDYVTLYYYKCLDMDTFMLTVYDTVVQKTMQIKLFDASFTADYDPNQQSLMIMPLGERRRETIPFLAHEIVYQLDENTVSVSSQDNHYILEASRNPYDSSTFVFSPGRSFIPEKITRNTLAWYTEHEYADFVTYNGFTIPHTILIQQYNQHPVTNEFWLKYEITFKVTDFKMEDNMSEKDLDIVIPAGTRIYDGFTNTGFDSPADTDGQTVTVRSIVKDMLKQ